MAAPNALATTVEVAATGLALSEEGMPGSDALHVSQRYGEERAKRLRPDGDNQFVDISHSDELGHFIEDPWADPAAAKELGSMFPHGQCPVLILGAGFGGLQYAVRMVQAGIRPEDIRIVDPAGGFGGTWYWNRYPGLACDVESYCYLPYLEETGYVPRHRYSYGYEIRNYANIVAEKWGVTSSAVFQTRAEGLTWNEELKEWRVNLIQERKGHPQQSLPISAKFVVAANGVLNWPKLPGVPGVADFNGKVFHTSRWDYDFTGGTQAEPSMTNLQDKRVAIIGTGATSVQLVPQLAHWCKHLYVIQRTPASVDERGQRETNADWSAKEVGNSSGWQRERIRNFHQHITTGPPPAVNLIDDSWTRATGIVSFAGNPAGPSTLEEIPGYVANLHAVDLPRTNRLRANVSATVKDAAIAEQLKAWYPTWCKRPTFNDEYLPAFNRPNVTLIATVGRGIDRLTTDSVVTQGGQTVPVDVVIFATGFRSVGSGSPAEQANISNIIGCNGISMSDSWKSVGMQTLHGLLDKEFPNLLLSGPFQAAASPCYLFNLDVLAKHAAYVVVEAQKRVGGDVSQGRWKSLEVAPTKEAADDWGTQCMMRALNGAAMVGCTPSYYNMEGKADELPQEVKMMLARATPWGRGVEDWADRIEAWRADGKMDGLEVKG